MRAMRVLLIEDNADLSANIWDYFESKGHEMDAANGGASGLHLAVENDYDVIVLDITLPDMDGFEVCRGLREEAAKSTPVLMLTARDALQDKLKGFASGADDYLVKPFALEELEARLQALARRATPDHAARTLTLADLTLDLHSLRVRRAGRPISLTPTGLKILEVLLRKPQRVVARRELERVLWGDTPPDSDALRAHIHALRSAIDKPFEVALLHTVHGIGYQLTDASCD